MIRILLAGLIIPLHVFAVEKPVWIKVQANDKVERTRITNLGFHIDLVEENHVIFSGKPSDIEKLKSKNLMAMMVPGITVPMDFPREDGIFHNYAEVQTELNKLFTENPGLVAKSVIGKSRQGRDITALTISTEVEQSQKKAGIAIMGTHHAREHLSTEVPLKLAQYLVSEFKNNNPEIVRLLTQRQVYIIPLVNPDGAEHDIRNDEYHSWRKNMTQNGDGSLGVDLNRNYSYFWGTGGSSTDPESDVFMGPTPFSEPETQAVKTFIETHENINILLSFHSFSQLVLYPWGHSYDAIGNVQDHNVFTKMAREMAAMNRYKPMQASELYIASGDTTDWAYGEHKIFAFTFELDPKSPMSGGFYPGAGFVEPVFKKNLQPVLYLMEYADNPYRVLNKSQDFGFATDFLRFTPLVH